MITLDQSEATTSSETFTTSSELRERWKRCQGAKVRFTQKNDSSCGVAQSDKNKTISNELISPEKWNNWTEKLQIIGKLLDKTITGGEGSQLKLSRLTQRSPSQPIRAQCQACRPIRGKECVSTWIEIFAGKNILDGWKIFGIHSSNICVKERVTTSLPMRCQYPGHVITLDETVIEYLKQDFSTSAILSSPYNENRAEGHNSNLWRQNEIHPRPIKPKNANLLKTSSLDEYLNFILC